MPTTPLEEPVEIEKELPALAEVEAPIEGEAAPAVDENELPALAICNLVGVCSNFFT